MKRYFLLVVMSVVSSIAWAQSGRGEIYGMVRDDDGGILPGVTVTLVDVARGFERAAVTNASGAYRFAGLIPGDYSLTAELAGFAPFRYEGIHVRLGQRILVDVSLQVAGVSETVTVTAESPSTWLGEFWRTRSSRSSSKRSSSAHVQTYQKPVIDWVAPPTRAFNTEAYSHIADNPFKSVLDHPLSTFSIDVDRASYANTRRFLNAYELPPKDAVRIEELINYFDYDYPEPTTDAPFSVSFEQAVCPWNPTSQLVRVALKGKDVESEDRPPGNFVFLLDVSGSMRPDNKLPLVRRSMKMLVNRLGDDDRVAIAVYAGASGLVLDSTPGSRKEEILDAIERLEAGGSTNGGEGIELAYDLAERHFIEGGVNRVILATDGDFNVGVTNHGDLVRLIEEKAKKRIFLSVLGFGMGNYKDSTLEQLADKGNGNYAYIDAFREARKVLVDEMSATLVTIAKDVKIQTEFNPMRVEAYRLIGYENRILEDEDFNDDTKDAGEIGAGHRVTALYELVPKGVDVAVSPVDPLKYQRPVALSDVAATKELLTVKLRYKEPEGDESELLSFVLVDERGTKSSTDFKFASAVAAFGMLLRDSPYRGSADWDQVRQLAKAGLGSDEHGYRREFMELVELASELSESTKLASGR